MLHCDICTKTNNHCCKADIPLDIPIALALIEVSGNTNLAITDTPKFPGSVVIVDKNWFTDPVEKAIRMLEVTGAGLTKDEFTEAYPESKYKLSTNRNDGLIAISEAGMLETQNWEEARVTINLTTKMVDMEGVYYLDEVDEEDEDETLDDIPELEYDLHTSISDFTKVYNEFHEKIESKNNYKVIDTNKQVLGVIG